MSVQGDFKDKIIGVEYISKKGKKIVEFCKNTMGRKIVNQLLLNKED